jgi:hypothetical protein
LFTLVVFHFDFSEIKPSLGQVNPAEMKDFEIARLLFTAKHFEGNALSKHPVPNLVSFQELRY